MLEERLSEFATLLIVLNPLQTLSMFTAMAGAFNTATQRQIATTAVLVSFAVLLFFIAAGGFVLDRLGISLRAFQIAGGLVLFLVALDMVRGTRSGTASATPLQDPTALAVYPLGIPIIAGPASMLTVVLLTDDHRFDVLRLTMTTGVLALVLAITYGVLLAAGPISRLFGESGVNVVGRVMGMLLIALAVQTVLSGLGSWLSLPKL